jgi:hypothetical protein
MKSDSIREPTRFDRFAAAVALAGLGLSWPVLDVLGNNAEFFLARHLTRGKVVGLALTVALVVPAVAGLLGLAPKRLGRAVSLVWLTLLGTVLALLLFRRLAWPGWAAQGAGLACGAGAAWAFCRFEPARAFFRYLIPTPLVLVGVFIFASPAGAIATDRGADIGSPVVPSNPVPVVMVVLDEFPLASLIDPAGGLRAESYPNFARLAAGGTWFRNAVTVQQQTQHSVPAMLTGVDPSQALVPFTGHYPDSLFTALAVSHRMVVDESITRLCPVSICQLKTAASFTTGSAGLAADLAVIAGHVLLPAWMSESLPPIDRSWGEFGTGATDYDAIAAFNQAREADRRLKLTNLAAVIAGDRGQGPALYFTHVLLPHNPWQFLPSGQSYPLDRERLPGSVGTGWGGDEWLAAQALQRHLLQCQDTDRALGEVIDAMQAAGIYEQAMLIVVADHGIAIRTNVEHWRRITPETIGEVPAVPLFIKAPGRPGGVIDDRRALTIDILPTIADVLGFNPPWGAEGLSLFGPDPGRTKTTTTGPDGSVTYGVEGVEKLNVAARIASWFPTGDPFELLPPGAPDLVGRSIDDLVDGEANFTMRIDRPRWYTDVDPEGEEIPVRITGRLVGASEGEVVLGVAVNGIIGAVTRSYTEEGKVAFQALVSPKLFISGRNQISLVWVSGGQVLTVPGPGD